MLIRLSLLTIDCNTWQIINYMRRCESKVQVQADYGFSSNQIFQSPHQMANQPARHPGASKSKVGKYIKSIELIIFVVPIVQKLVTKV